jgi:hypothetical protein
VAAALCGGLFSTTNAMKLDYAYFAIGAEVSAEGKLHVFGGEIGGVTFPSFPSSPMNLHFVIKLLAPPSDVGRKRVLSLTYRRRGGDQSVRHRQDISIEPIANPLDPTADAGLFVIAIMALGFESPGIHDFSVAVDGELLRSVPLYVSEAESKPNGVTALPAEIVSA